MNSRQPEAGPAGVGAGYGGGHVALTGPLLRLFRDLDRVFLRWAADSEADEYLFPPLIPACELNRIGYFKSFPQHLTLPAYLDDDADNLASFAESEPLGTDGALRLGRTGAVRDVLTPAACYHFYVNFQGQTLDAPRYVTTRATCFRREKTFTPLRRQWSFSMREIVCIGSCAEVADFLAARRRSIEEFVATIGLSIAWEGATDAFFNPAGNPKYLAQKLDPVKTEMVYDGTLAIGSINFHRNYFGDAFGISRDGVEAFSGCVAFGLDRWLAAFVGQYGDDPARWPDLRGWF